MRSARLVCAVAFLALSSVSWSSSGYVVPTTTIAALTGNNTSAANSFGSQVNGNRGAGNISKVDVHTLLYSGNTTRVYAHMVMWWGESSHINIGYSSIDPNQVHNQITDMISRGIDGVIIDWYGPGNRIDQATGLVMAEAEKHPGFTFAIMIDEGALKWDSCWGCSPQQALVNQLQYIEKTYFPSPAYMTLNGQPMVTNFNVDLAFGVDWNAANAAMSTHPLFVFQNNNGFNHVLSGGSYAWVMPTASDYGIDYLNSFYDAGKSYPNEHTVGATYKGFNDKLASWGSHRVMSQQCGQTWLQTFSDANGLYNSGKQLPEMQLVTWNDYEEATEIESGIDNCLSISSASVSSNNLQWSISGDENTVDHYTVYISTDGQNLMPLSDTSPGNRTLNLCSYSIPSGSYKLFVQAVGKPSLANQLSSSINYTPSCAATTGAPSSAAKVAMSASPSTLTIAPGASGQLTLTAKLQSGVLTGGMSLSCNGLPANFTCAFSPSTIQPGTNGTSSSVTISSTGANGMHRGTSNVALLSINLLPVGISVFTWFGGVPGRRKRAVLGLIAILALGMITVACGGSSPSAVQRSAVNAPGQYTVTLQGNSGGSQFSTTVNVTVQ